MLFQVEKEQLGLFKYLSSIPCNIYTMQIMTDLTSYNTAKTWFYTAVSWHIYLFAI